MSKKLRALVHGSGFAGQGHTEAFRNAGVEISGMVSRTKSVVENIANQMNIEYASTDWDKALAEIKPDIAIIGTPGGAHFNPILSAIEYGCHIFCDKPLATTSEKAKQLYKEAKKKGVKTAFGASFRYQPHALLAKEMVAKGDIGVPYEVECISHYNLELLIPWGWSHKIDLGGGRLSNNFTHKLSIVENVLNGRVRRINGETRNDMHVAPVVEGVHDFRKRKEFAPTRREALKNPERWEWRDVDSEWTYTVMGRLQSEVSNNTKDTVSLLFKHCGIQPRFNNDYIAFFGSEGAIHIEGAYAQGPLYLHTRDSQKWEKIPLPENIRKSVPEIAGDTQRNWTYLVQEFVNDILGKGYTGYQTFREGWIYQEIVDSIRRADGWFLVPEDIS